MSNRSSPVKSSMQQQRRAGAALRRPLHVMCTCKEAHAKKQVRGWGRLGSSSAFCCAFAWHPSLLTYACCSCAQLLGLGSLQQAALCLEHILTSTAATQLNRHTQQYSTLLPCQPAPSTATSRPPPGRPTAIPIPSSGVNKKQRSQQISNSSVSLSSTKCLQLVCRVKQNNTLLRRA
jgi:hypothetical protein